MKIREIATALGCPWEGDGEREIEAVRALGQAGPADLSFVTDRRNTKEMATSAAGVLIIPKDFPPADRPVIRSPNVYLSFARVMELFHPSALPMGPFVHPTAVVDPSAEVGEGCYIGPCCVVGAGARLGHGVRLLGHCMVYPGAEVGDAAVLHSHSIVREGCRLGRNVVLQNGAVIGSDGFGFAPDGEGRYHKIPQVARVVVEDDVEIGAYTCIDRGSLEDTVIGRGTKLDNLIQVAHGCRIGSDCVMAAQVGMAGSTRIGNRVRMAGQVGLAGHLTIGDGVTINAQSGVAHDIPAGGHVAGSPHVDVRQWRRVVVAEQKLPELLRRVRELEKRAGQDAEGDDV